MADHSCGADYSAPESADQHAADAVIRAARELRNTEVVSLIRRSLFHAAIDAADTSVPLPRRRTQIRFPVSTFNRSRSPPAGASHAFLAPGLVACLARIRSGSPGTLSPASSDSDNG